MNDETYLSNLRSGFIRGRVAAIITEYNERPFLEWCESVGIRWCAGGERPTEWIPSYNGGYVLHEGIALTITGGYLSVVRTNYKSIKSKLQVYADELICDTNDDIVVDDASLCQLLQ